MVTPALLAAVAGLLVFGLVRAVRLRWPFDALFVLLAILALCSNWWVLLFPKDLLRTIALPFALLPFVVAGKRSAAAVAPDVLRDLDP